CAGARGGAPGRPARVPRPKKPPLPTSTPSTPAQVKLQANRSVTRRGRVPGLAGQILAGPAGDVQPLGDPLRASRLDDRCPGGRQSASARSTSDGARGTWRRLAPGRRFLVLSPGSLPRRSLRVFSEPALSCWPTGGPLVATFCPLAQR